MTRVINARDKPCVSTVLECKVILRPSVKEQRLRLIDLNFNNISGSTDFIPAAVYVKYHNVGVLRYPRLSVIELNLWIHSQRLYDP